MTDDEQSKAIADAANALAAQCGMRTKGDVANLFANLIAYCALSISLNLGADRACRVLLAITMDLREEPEERRNDA